jgi:hypothetical protein
MSYEHWSDFDKGRLREAVADGVPNSYLIGMFLGRSPAAVLTKVKYEQHRKFINEQRAQSRNGEAPPIDNADYIAACLSNQEQDERFCDAMRSAIQAGHEQMPRPAPIDYAEFRPAPFHPAPRVSYGGSPAAQCAELGSL